MARPLRLEYPGALHHVTARGNGGQVIFGAAADKDLFLAVMSSVFHRFSWRCCAYCLMDNHYHLVVETQKENLSSGMRQLNSIWAQRFNKMKKRSGHLFQGRFKAFVIEKEPYLLEVLRYVVLNPVRADICRKPVDYPYSSFAKTAGAKDKDGFLDTGWVLSQFGKQKAAARALYSRFVYEGIDEKSPFENVKAGLFLGSDEFVAKHTGDLADEHLKEIPKIQRPDPKPPLRNLIKDKQDKEAIYYAFREWGYTSNEDQGTLVSYVD